MVSLGHSSSKDPMMENCRFHIDKGFSTPFLETKWMGEIILKEEFPEVYLLSRFKMVLVGGMGGWSNGVWCWGDLGINYPSLSTTILNSISNLRFKLANVVFDPNISDKVIWKVVTEGIFPVASCYLFYDSFRIPFSPCNRNDGVVRKIWKMNIPFKIKVFAWRFL